MHQRNYSEGGVGGGGGRSFLANTTSLKVRVNAFKNFTKNSLQSLTLTWPVGNLFNMRFSSERPLNYLARKFCSCGKNNLENS